MIQTWLAANALKAAGVAILGLALTAGVQTARLWKLQADTADTTAQLDVCRGANTQWQELAAAQGRERDEAEAKRRAAEERAFQALLAAESAKEDAQADFNEWKRRWERRPQTCAIALTQMEAACASSLSDY
jgi:hypothetical protein